MFREISLIQWSQNQSMNEHEITITFSITFSNNYSYMGACLGLMYQNDTNYNKHVSLVKKELSSNSQIKLYSSQARTPTIQYIAIGF